MAPKPTNHTPASVSLGKALVGPNLNLLVLRGFASLGDLSSASSADIYDQVTNPQGTQRDLNKTHAQECFDYAADAIHLDPETSPRAFPEVVLNVRPEGLEYVTLTGEDGLEISKSDLENPDTRADLVGKMVSITISTPGSKGMVYVSRVDGNHRLHAAAANRSSAGAGAMIPYALYLNLNVRQEAGLFVDLNSKQHKMNTSHLKTLTVTTTDTADLAQSNISLFLANELTREGQAFFGAFRGGSKAGLRRKNKNNGSPAKVINFNTIETIVKHGMSHVSVELRSWVPGYAASRATALGIPAEEMEHEVKRITRETWAILVSTFWTAVTTVFAAEWNSKEHILRESIGLTGLARYWAHTVNAHLVRCETPPKSDPRFYDAQAMQSLFVKELGLAKANIDLTKDRWRGFSGAGGATRVYEELIKSATAGNSTVQLAATRSGEDPLATSF